MPLLTPARLRRLAQSPAVVPVLAFGASGAGFTVANLILARHLPEREFAVVTLALALMNLGAPLAATGLDGVVLRGGIAVGRPLLAPMLLSAAVVAAVVGLVATVYGIGLLTALTTSVATLAGGAMSVAAAEFQRRQRLLVSLALLQSPNLVLLLAAVGTVAIGVTSARLPLAVAALGFVASGLCGWWLLLRERGRVAATDDIPWRQAYSIAASNASGTLMGQLDRLIIPWVLPPSALATYGVLSAVVGSLFRVLQRGVGYALVPRLSAAPGPQERRRLVAAEARTVAAVVLVASVLIALAIPAVERWLLAGRYHFGAALVGAALLAGWAKMVNAFGRATVTALADARELALMNAAGWAAVAVGVVAAALGARWDLAGVIGGVALGWLVRAGASLAVTARHLRVRS